MDGKKTTACTNQVASLSTVRPGWRVQGLAGNQQNWDTVAWMRLPAFRVSDFRKRRTTSKLLKPAPVCFSLRCSRKKMDACRSAVHRDLLRAQGCSLLSTQASSPAQSRRGPQHAARSASRPVRPAPASTGATEHVDVRYPLTGGPIIFLPHLQ